jgi:hypothetical protein
VGVDCREMRGRGVWGSRGGAPPAAAALWRQGSGALDADGVEDDGGAEEAAHHAVEREEG